MVRRLLIYVIDDMGVMRSVVEYLFRKLASSLGWLKLHVALILLGISLVNISFSIQRKGYKPVTLQLFNSSLLMDRYDARILRSLRYAQSHEALRTMVESFSNTTSLPYFIKSIVIPSYPCRNVYEHILQWPSNHISHSRELLR